MLFAPTKFFTWLGLFFIFMSFLQNFTFVIYSQIADITVLLLFLADLIVFFWPS